MKYLSFYSLCLLVLIPISSVQAKSVTWEVSFFSEGKTAGMGSFSFDPEFFLVYTETPAPESGQWHEVYGRITDYRFGIDEEFETTSDGVHYDTNTFTTIWTPRRFERPVWWGEAGGLPGSITGSRDGSFLIPTLQVGDTYNQPGFGAREFLQLYNLTEKTDSFAAGSWTQQKDYGNNRLDGTWTAKALVPIPGSFLLFGGGLMTLIMAEIKKRRRS